MLHSCILEMREELRHSSYGVFHLSEVYSRKYGIDQNHVLIFFKRKYPNLYPLAKEGDDA